jgi:probable phosphoglycerate mutase
VPTLYLARHGETDWNRIGRWQGATDVPLNDEGRAQARALAERVRPHGVVRVHASDLARARQTAEIVAAALPARLSGHSAHFRERSFGVFEGLTRAECEARWPDAWCAYLHDVRNTPPDAEAAPHVVARMLEGLHAVVEEAPHEPCLIVTHGASLRMLLASIAPPGAPREPPIHNGALFRLRLEARVITRVERL